MKKFTLAKVRSEMRRRGVSEDKIVEVMSSLTNGHKDCPAIPRPINKQQRDLLVQSKTNRVVLKWDGKKGFRVWTFEGHGESIKCAHRTQFWTKKKNVKHAQTTVPAKP
jgi:hypothetical protein